MKDYEETYKNAAQENHQRAGDEEWEGAGLKVHPAGGRTLPEGSRM